VEKDELIGVHVERERTTRRATTSGVAGLSILAVAAVVLAITAGAEGRRATDQSEAADARLLAASALAVTDTDAERAVLLAAEGYRLNADNQTFTALLRSIESTGPLDRRTDLGADVVALAAAPPPENDNDNDGDSTDDTALPGTVVAGTSAGTVWRWRLDQDPERLVTLDGPVNEVAVSRDGRTVAAVADGRLWVEGPDGSSTDSSSATDHARVIDVAVASDGEHLAVVLWDDDTHELLLLDRTGRERISSAELTGTALDTVALGEDAVVLAQRRVRAGNGHWQRRTVPDLEVVDDAGVVERQSGELVDHQVSPDGVWVTAVQAGSVVAVDTTRRSQYRSAAPASLGELLPAVATASDDDAARMLVSRRDETWVIDLPVRWHPQARALHGMPTADAAAFLDADRLVTAHGGILASWDLTAASPLTRSVELDQGYTTDTALSPDGEHLATAGSTTLPDTHGNYDVAASYDLTRDGDGALRTTFRSIRPGRIGDRLLPVPLDDGRLLVVGPEDGTVSEATGAVPAADLANPVPVLPTEARFETGLRSVRAARAVGDRLVLADGFGRVQVWDLADGRLVHQDRAAHAATSGTWAVEAAISPDGRYVAFHDLYPLSPTSQDATISVLDLSQSRTRTLTVAARQNITHLGLRTEALVLDLTYDDDKLLAAQADGVLVVERDGSHVRTRIASASGSTGAYASSALAPVPGTSLVARAGEVDWIRLYDTSSGLAIGSLTPPDAAGGLDQLWLGAGPGSLLALSGYDAVRWDLRPATLVAAACGFAGRDLTAAEWTQAVGSTAPDDLTCDRDL
jgi:WD40 repeat protein